MNKKSFGFFMLGAAFGLLLVGYTALGQWQGPSGAPPTNNVDTPVNTGVTDQIKAGGIFVGSFAADGGIAVTTDQLIGKPACDAANGPVIRGTLWFTHGAAGVKDALEVCAKDAGDVYDWRILY